MAKMEQLEMDAHRAELIVDVQALVEKYQSIFGWDVPDIDEPLSDQLIFAALKQALSDIEQASTARVSG
ncbi:MAG: hypothetical protein RI925_174 [Pseudomonadota bacterium]|jgi:hypothetical protein